MLWRGVQWYVRVCLADTRPNLRASSLWVSHRGYLATPSERCAKNFDSIRNLVNYEPSSYSYKPASLKRFLWEYYQRKAARFKEDITFKTSEVKTAWRASTCQKTLHRWQDFGNGRLMHSAVSWEISKGILPACDTPFQPHFSRQQFRISPPGIRPFMRSNKRRRSNVMVTLS